MQIDFHHAVTYVIARFAGFCHDKASIVAYASQYVDDATNSGVIRFDNGALYSRISSAYPKITFRYFRRIDNQLVWIPFHFLPGNCGEPAGGAAEASFVDKATCLPGGPVAEAMVRMCIENSHQPYGLHRLGITMHVLADTWAHQGFVGTICPLNKVRAIDDYDHDAKSWLKKTREYITDKWDAFWSSVFKERLPLGHGAVLTYPDRPYLVWEYTDHQGVTVPRDNRDEFLLAANAMFKAMQRYRLNDPDADVPDLTVKQSDLLKARFRNFTDADGEKRHRLWLQDIEAGCFGFPGEALTYRPKKTGSWKHAALRTEQERDEDETKPFPWSKDFLSSDWKMFHDALQSHRFDVLHDVLPRFGISAA